MPASRSSSRAYRWFGVAAMSGSIAWHCGILDPAQSIWSGDVAWLFAAHATVDALLWGGVFWVVAGLASRVGSIAARAALLSIGVAWSAYLCAVRTIDFGYFRGGGWHLDHLFVQHAHSDLLDVPLTAEHKVGIAIACVIAVAMIAAYCVATLRPKRMPASQSLAGICAAPVLLAAVLGAFGMLLPTASQPPRHADHWAWPELTLPGLYWTAPADTESPEGLEASADIRRTAAALGLEVDAEREFPLIRPNAFSSELPFDRTPRFRARPNVIIIFLEAYSAALTSLDADSEFPGITPNLEDMARRGHVIRGCFNASTPTITGVVASFTSHLSITDSVEWYEFSDKRWNALPRILHDQGYDTEYVHPVDNLVMRTGDVLRRLGFARVIGRPFVERTLDETAAGWGLSDRQLFAFLRRRLERGEMQEPFLLSMKTMDAHPPYSPTPGAQPYGDGEHKILNAVHSTDQAFGEFWDYFKASPFAHNTIFVVLSDHAMVPGSEYRAVRAEDIYHRVFDEIPFVIYTPMHDIVGESFVLSSQLDLAPTVLQLCGIDARNHFDGHSVFDSQRPNVVAGATSRRAFIAWSSADQSFEVERFDLANTAGEGNDSAPFGRRDLADLLHWKRSLLRADRIWDTRNSVDTDPEWIAARIRELRDSEPSTRRRAAEQIGELGIAGAAAAEPLVAAMGDSDEQVRVAVLGAMAQIGPSTLPFLMQRLDTDNPQQRLATLLAIGVGGTANRAAAPRIEKIVASTVGPEHLIAVSTLVRVDPSNDLAATEVAALLASDHEPTRTSIVRGLAGELLFGGKAALRSLPQLIHLLAADDTAGHAAAIIGRIGPAAAPATDALAAALARGNRRVIGLAIVNIGPGAAPAAPALARVAKQSSIEDQFVLVQAIAAIRVASPEVRDTLTELGASPDRDLARLAAQTLADLGL